MKFSDAQEQAITEAVAAAERGSTGELRVLVLGRCKGSVLDEAKQHFERLGLTATKGRTGVLLVVCPRDRKAAILGDAGIHDKVGDAFWRLVIDRAIGYFAAGDVLLGILSAVDEIGQAFRKHLPAERGEGNELPDRVERG
jgi:uncharacterized membrane protein